jgi:hypothetical protein
MSRILNSAWLKVDPLRFASDRPAHEGHETDLLENVNFLHARTFHPHVFQHWQSDTTGRYIEPTTTAYVLNGIWRLPVPSDATAWEFYYYLENGGSQSANIYTELESDTATYNDTRTINASTAAGYVGPATLSLDPSQAKDTIRLYTKENVAGAALRIHSTTIAPDELNSISAGVSNDGVTPYDTTEADANEPLTPYHREVLGFDNLDAIRKKRIDVLVGWSEDWNVRSGDEAYQTTSSSDVLMIKIPFTAGEGQDTIGWSCTGYHAASGTGTVTAYTGYMLEQGTSQAVSLTTKAASPYASNVHDGTDLDCLPNKADWLYVYLKGDGTRLAYLMGFCAWFAEVA